MSINENSWKANKNISCLNVSSHCNVTLFFVHVTTGWHVSFGDERVMIVWLLFLSLCFIDTAHTLVPSNPEDLSSLQCAPHGKTTAFLAVIEDRIEMGTTAFLAVNADRVVAPRFELGDGFIILKIKFSKEINPQETVKDREGQRNC